MKNKFLTLICIMIIAAMTFSGCVQAVQNNTINNTNTPDDCEHTYSPTWTSNSEQHWHASNCDHTDLKSDVGYHIDENEDGKCDVCNRNTPHVHTFNTIWVSDNEFHWNTATCTHTTVKGNLAAHSDKNADGVCDVCNSEFEIVLDGTPASILAQIIRSKGGVSSYTVNSSEEVISLGKDGISTSQSNAYYVFGSNCVYSRVETTAYQSLDDITVSGHYEKWQEYITADTVFGISTEDDSPLALDGAANTDTIQGHYFTVSTLADAYTPENILYLLYQLSQQSEAVSNYIWEENNGAYTFSYDYLQINRDVAAGEEPNVNFYKVSVAFKHNENYVLTDLTIVCECYTNSLADEVDNDYTYDDTTGTITMKPEGEYAADTYTFVISQTAGDRTYVNENPRNKFLPDTFEVFTDEERTTFADSTINAYTNTKGAYRLFIGQFIPEGTSISFFPDFFGASFDDGENVYHSTIAGIANEKFYLAHNAIDQDVVFKFYMPGTYTLTISIGNENTKTIVINVEEGTGGNAGEVLVEEWNVDLKGRFSWDQSESNKLDVISFTATESGNYVFKLPTPDSGAYDKIAYDETYGTSNPIGAFIDPFAIVGGDYQGGEFSVYLNKGQTYEFYVGSYIAQTIQIQCYISY